MKILIGLSFILVFLLSFNQSKGQDLIYKKDEKIIAGKILMIDTAFIHFREITDLNGATIFIPKSEVVQIKFDYSKSTDKKLRGSDYIRAKNAVSFGIGGTGGIFSINYDRIILENPNFFLSLKGGIGSWVSQTNLNFHITGNYNFGQSKHYLEFGIGGAIGLGQFDRYYKYYASVPIIGYRYQPKSEGLLFRAYACTFVLIQDAFNNTIGVPMLAVDLGFAF